METEFKTIDSFDKTPISYSVTGDGPALLLLHGNGGSSKYFYYQIHFFSQFFTVFAIDSRDHGRSGNYSDFLSFQQMSQDILAIIQTEKLSAVTLLGFSDGANLALAFAASYPQYVRRLILNAPNLYNHGVKRISFWLSKLAYYLIYPLQILSKHFKRFTRLLSLLIKDPDIPVENLDRIDCPCLLIIGSRDVITEKHIREIAALLPHPQVQIIYGGKHALSKQHPALFNYVVMDFVRNS